MNQDRNSSKGHIRSCRSALHILSFSTAAMLSSLPVTAFMSNPSQTIPSTLPRYDHTTHTSLTHNSSPSAFAFVSASASLRQPNTALNVWWFGGSDTEEDDESCELVAVRIERTSANSRRIAGDIIIPKPVNDVWAILTDYDNLAIHVPNLVASKRVNPGTEMGGVPGDGSYRCRLFQKGAQKIVGFEFGASLTMDMTEEVHLPTEEKKIMFKCVESQFFSEYDGEWKITPTTDPDDPSQIASKVQYVVDVRPRGPVPVQALEWRIREDVPTNLIAVKAASITLGEEGVLALKDNQRRGRDGSANYSTSASSSSVSRRSTTYERSSRAAAGSIANVATNTGRLMNRAATASKNAVVNATAPRMQPKLAPVRVDWYEDETMAAYLNKKR